MLNRTVVLSDMNNDRATWINASRTLLKTLELKERIITEEYQVAYELEEERARNELHESLCIKDGSTGEREPLPPQFFYGITDWETRQSLDKVAKKVSPKPIVSEYSIDTVDPTPKKERLCVESVVAIFKFMEYPKDYNDPLDGVKVWDESPRGYFARNDQGARKYVLHRQEESSRLLGGS